MAVQIQLRNDLAANWTAANPTLAIGEIGVESDTNSVKVGDGSTAWNSLGYFGVSSAYVTNQINSLIDSAPGTLDTLNEIAAAIGDDANFITTVTNSLATKQDVVANVSDTEIGYLDGVTSGIQGQLDAKIPLAQTVADKATNYSILAADAGTLITNSAAVTITIDDVLSVGEQIDFLQMGADQITFAQGTATNLYSKDGNLKTAAQYSPASIKCVSSGNYVLVGDLGS